MPDSLESLLNTSDGVLVANTDQKIISWNRAAEGILGYEAEEVRGEHCHRILQGKEASGELFCREGCRAQGMARGGEIVPTCELLASHKDGYEVWLSLTTVIAPKRRRDSALIAHIFRDISRAKEMERFVRSLASHLAEVPWLQEGESLPGRSANNASRNGVLALTVRELEILRLLASGTSTQAISERLCISPLTVKNHTQNILAKLRAHSRLEAVARAFHQGLV